MDKEILFTLHLSFGILSVYGRFEGVKSSWTLFTPLNADIHRGFRRKGEE